MHRQFSLEPFTRSLDQVFGNGLLSGLERVNGSVRIKDSHQSALGDILDEYARVRFFRACLTRIVS